MDGFNGFKERVESPAVAELALNCLMPPLSTLLALGNSPDEPITAILMAPQPNERFQALLNNLARVST
jgi:hypothetical protein